MGVGFFPCDGCGDTVCDYGNYKRCNDDCGKRFCSRQCAEKNGLKSDDECDLKTCNFCRKEDANDSQLLYWLLKRFFLTRKRALDLYRKHHRDKNGKEAMD